ncbi:MAG TPA: response regulator [Polyangiaceae bacterium]|jgi:two-component system chemotaxis response regulator CheY|nr:response regulator [Polyangiaceae bacterium]
MHPKKILIVDDSSSIRQQVSDALGDAGFSMVEAADGLEGAETIHACTELSLVICDINMPRLSGLEMLDSVKDELTRRGLPVVMLTTEADPEAIAQARRAGAKAWLVKPFKDQLLVAVARKLTRDTP